MGGLAKGLEVLLAFGRGKPELTLSEVADLAGLSPATARRCLLTLQEEGYVRVHQRRFFLSPRVLQLSASFLESLDIERLIQPHLTSLAAETDDAAAVTVLQGNDIVYIARSSARALMRLEAYVGSRFPAFCTAHGRVLLAGRSQTEVDAALSGDLPQLTDFTITDPAKLKSLISAADRDGYAVVEDELAYGVISLAVPVRDRDGKVLAALNSSSHSKRIDRKRLVTERLELVRAHASRLAAELEQVPQAQRILTDFQ